MADPPVSGPGRSRPQTDEGFQIDGVRVDRSLTDLLAAVAATAIFDGTLYVVVRFLPEYLRVRGVGPVAIGAFGTLWLAATSLRRSGDRRLAILLGCATAGVLGWLVVPTVTDGATALWLAFGATAVAVSAWYWSALATGVPLADAWPPATGLDRRPGGAFWLLGPLALAITVFVLSASFQAGFRVVLALTVALGAAAAALWVSLDTAGPRVPTRRDGSVPRLGDHLLETATGVTAVFVVLVVTGVLDLDLVVFGVRFGSAATFGLLLLIETVTGAFARTLRPLLARSLGRGPLVVYGGAAVAGFPLLLLSVPSTPLAVGALFAVYGTRAVAGVPARGEASSGPRAFDRRRVVVLSIGPLFGGLLFAMDPVLAFGLATAIGTVGVWELAQTHLFQPGWRDR